MPDPADEVLMQIAAKGFGVRVFESQGRITVTVTDPASGRSESVEVGKRELLDAAVTLAERLGIELEGQ